METLMPQAIYTMLANAANNGCDLPATLTGCFKDMRPGTMALLTLLRSASGKPNMIHVAWRTMCHEQPADVMTIGDVESNFAMVGTLRHWQYADELISYSKAGIY